MAIPTVSYVTLNDNDKIGLSDTLDNYSIDDIKASGYVGAYDPLRTNCHTAERISMWEGIEALNLPFTGELVGTPYPSSHKLDSGSGVYTGAVFSAVVWLYVDGNGESHTPDIVINQNDIANYKLVTEMPANKMYYTVPSLNNWNSGAGTPVSASSWNDEKTFPSSYYAPGTGALNYHSHYGEADDIVAGVMYTYPYMMYEFDGYFYFQLFTQQWDYYAWWMRNTTNPPDLEVVPFASSAMTPYTEDSYISLGTVYNMDVQTGNNALSNLNYGTVNTLTGQVWAGPSDWAQSTYGAYNTSDTKYLMWYAFGGTGHTLDMQYHTTLAQKDDSLLFFANSGVKIIADKPYKPIIIDGVVTGITDDMSDPSELDEWGMGATDHGVSPSGPPSPSPSGDDEVDMPLYAASYGSGLTHYYICTKDSGVLSTIAAALSRWDISQTGKDLFKNLISCKLARIGQVPAVNSTFVIYGEELHDEDDDPIQINEITGNPTVDLGEYRIDRFFNDFRDFAPYTKVEVFVPFCGWLPLPSHVMGNKISGTLIVDIISGTCKAVIKCGRTVVAEGAGVCALDVPFVAENVGMKMAGIANSIVSYGKTVSGAIGGVAGSGSAAAAGAAAAGAAVSVLGSYAQMYMAFNANYTEVCGKTADGCNTGGLTSLYIKVQRPNYKRLGFDAPLYVPDGFAHSNGFIAMKQKKVSECTGYIECANVDTSNISGATDREKEIIKRYLESGIIVEHPSEP